MKYVSSNLAEAIRAGSNPATYRYEGKTVKVEGKLFTLGKNWNNKNMLYSALYLLFSCTQEDVLYNSLD